MQNILIIEDNEDLIELFKDYAEEYLKNHTLVILNPNETSLEDILKNIASNNYTCILLDHNYSRVSYTGEKIFEECDYKGDIFSISSAHREITYCNRFIEKMKVKDFLKNFEAVHA